MRRSGGVDLSLTKDWVGIAVVENVDRMYYVRLLDAIIPPKGGKIDLVEIEEEIYALASKFNCPFYFDQYQSVSMQQRLIRRGVQCIEFVFTTDSRRRLIGRYLDLIEEGRIKARFHLALKKQLSALITKRLPSGGWRIDHRVNQRDDLIIAIALALEGLPEMAPEMHKPEAIGRRQAFLGAEGASDELVGWELKGMRGVPPKKAAWDVW